jgi:hypothetical protein
MPNVYVEPRPKGRPDGSPITDYVLEFAGGQQLGSPFRTQAEAADPASIPRTSDLRSSLYAALEVSR